MPCHPGRRGVTVDHAWTRHLATAAAKKSTAFPELDRQRTCSMRAGTESSPENRNRFITRHDDCNTMEDAEALTACFLNLLPRIWDIEPVDYRPGFSQGAHHDAGKAAVHRQTAHHRWSGWIVPQFGWSPGRQAFAEVDLGTTGGVYFLQARLNVSLPGLDREVAQALVDAADQACPYSKATRGNIDVVIKLV